MFLVLVFSFPFTLAPVNLPSQLNHYQVPDLGSWSLSPSSNASSTPTRHIQSAFILIYSDSNFNSNSQKLTSVILKVYGQNALCDISLMEIPLCSFAFLSNSDGVFEPSFLVHKNLLYEVLIAYFLNWSTVVLVSGIQSNDSNIYIVICIYSFFQSFFIIGYCKILTIVPNAIQ